MNTTPSWSRESGASPTDLEWIETDGRGGFSSGTVALAPTRCYHAVLNPAVDPPLGRRVLWSTADEAIRMDGRSFPLHSRFCMGALESDAQERLLRFDARPLPRWTFRIGNAELVRELFLVHGTGEVLLSWTWHGRSEAHLDLRPYLAFRDHHAVAGRGDDGSIEPTGDRWIVRFRGDHPRLQIAAPGAAFAGDPGWIDAVSYPIETYRGLPDRESLWSPGTFTLPMHPGTPTWVRAGLELDDVTEAGSLRKREIARREALVLDPPIEPAALGALAGAADQFLVRREDKTTVIAGYPWFTDWGRDTMIALPGLTLARGRPDLARELLLTFADHLRDGLIPNRFPDEGEEPEYNTVDATLWMAVALHHTLQAADDPAFARRMLSVLTDAREHHERGTRHGIRMDDDGLLLAGEPGVQLTWMDAKVEDWVVTPRIGKPVEIQALWYNFLGIGGTLSIELGEDPAPWKEQADAVKQAFLPAFWDEDRGYLADVVGADGSPDASLRPNQLLALSLPFPLVDERQAERILAIVREHLATPRGLRSLDPRHPDYHPHYGGDRRTRDAAYHQGTVWGWLHGPYMEARLRFGGSAGRQEVMTILQGWVEHLDEGCLGQVAEIFDPEPPFAPRGCPAQAWSVAELLRIARML